MDLHKKGYQMKVLSALEKIFPDTEPTYRPECTALTALKGETVSFQVGYATPLPDRSMLRFSLHSPLQEQKSVKLRLRTVELVPAGYLCHTDIDDNYLRTAPGLYPDLLRDCEGRLVRVTADQWHALWVDLEVGEEALSGRYPITVEMKDEEGETLAEATAWVTLYDVSLPPQKLRHTEWFHADCLADYYQVPVLSEEHWRIMENFIRLAAKRGMNMLLTPMFTPPLDTKVGGERTTVQLVGVTVEEGRYTFDFANLKRWIDLCNAAGIQYLEMSHLFTQWGAKAAPKVMARVDGEYRKLFGWDTPAVGGEYARFLAAYLPALTGRLREWGVADRVCFHISDEPGEADLANYQAAKAQVMPYLEGFQIIDALSSYEFYQHGAVARPIPAINHITPFLEHQVPGLWAYYCTSQYLEVSNRFFAMPSARNRAYSLPLFKYEIEGILHWGYNFYNSQYSLYPIDPYRITDSDGAFPAGDPFLVYPGEGGQPEESIRMMVLFHALSDLRAMELLARLTSRAHVLERIEEDLGEPVTFSTYPKSDYYYLRLRNSINRELNALLHPAQPDQR